MADKKKKNEKGFKEHDPEKYINVEPVIDEAVKKSIVVTFGRFNPITVGHEKLVNRVIAEAISRKADVGVYMSHSQDPKKNPLSYNDKIGLAQQAFGKVVKKSKARTLIDVAKELSGKYSELVVVVGSDREKEFETLMNKYNGKDYTFETIKIVSAGERDPDVEGVKGMSASKMREYAADKNLEKFTKGLPKRLKSSAAAVMATVRSGMGMNESVEELDEAAPLSRMARRRRALIMKRYKTKIAAGRKRAKRKMASREKLEKRARRKALEFMRNRLMKNKKYSEMSPAEKIALDKRLAKVSPKVIDRIAKRLLPKVRSAEKARLKSVLTAKNESTSKKPQDPDVKDMPGSQPKGYYKGVAKDKKDDRARHFAKYSKMDDDNPAAYKPAPGDKEAETKPSVHTKKYKQMFGEMNEWVCGQCNSEPCVCEGDIHEASCADTKVRKRPHMGLLKNGAPKLDRRFKIFKDKQPMNEQSFENPIVELDEFVEAFEDFLMTEQFDELNESNPKKSLKDKAAKTGISYSILKQVFDRGVAAWRTGHRPGTTPTQWGLARVNSFVTKGKGTWGKADKDLAAKVRKEEVEITEQQATARAKLKIAREKTADARKHDRMLDAAKRKDKLAKQRLQKDLGEGVCDIMSEDLVIPADLKKKMNIRARKEKVVMALRAIQDMIKSNGGDIGSAAFDVARQFNIGLNSKELVRVYNATMAKQEAEEVSTKREWGTDSLTKSYKKDTPGQDIEEERIHGIKRGDRVRFEYDTVASDAETLTGVFVGVDDQNTSKMKIMADNGKIYKTSFENVTKI